MARLFATFARLTHDLTRLDQIFHLNDELIALRTPEDEALVLAEFARTEVGADALRTRHRLGQLELATLMELPEDTLGGAFARFMAARGIDPGNLPAPTATTDIEYVVAHLYETHDLWHVLTGFDVDVAGELGLQAFLLAQTRAFLPLFVMAAVALNTVLVAYEEKTVRMDALVRGWQLGKRAKSLIGVNFAPHLTRPLAEVRRVFALAEAA
jgi:ubiquinone biosynthesis protein Coq4